MTWIFLDVAVVRALHEQQIARYGGSHGLRDAGLLESAVARAENTANYREDATAAEIAASLAWGLIKNHPFVDGNKRIGWVSALAFLRLNGFRVVATTEERYTAVLNVASCELSEGAWSDWLGQHVEPMKRRSD